MSPKRLRVLIADDSTDVREALAELIRREPTFVLVGAVADATDAIALAAAEQPDVALLDVRMPGGGGKAAAEGIGRCSPGSKLIALSEHDDRATVLAMLQAGVIAYLVKGGTNKEIVEAIKSAAQGEGSLSSNVTNDIVQTLTGHLRARARTSGHRRTSKARIQRAIRDEAAFTMVYQPIFELRTRALVGAESLARFTPPPRRAPEVWFAEAASAGLGEELEVATARKALETLPQLPRDVFLSVNVSAATLATAQFHELVAGAGGESLVAEITEHAPVQDYDRVADAVGKLRALGMRIAVDDAGAGFASFRHVLELSPELIKLDLALIRGIHRDRAKQALATGLISFARESGATIIAEGVERAQELESLVALGIVYGQGYFLGRPAPLPLACVTTDRTLTSSPRT